jgi:hypothetical protein
MSAIEVLKEWNNKPIIFDESFMTKEDYIEQVNLKVATQEALLALEQKDVKDTEIRLLHKQITNYERILNGLNEWLEKEIVAGRIKQSRAQTQGESVRQTISMTRLKALREVLGFLELSGEQK